MSSRLHLVGTSDSGPIHQPENLIVLASDQEVMSVNGGVSNPNTLRQSRRDQLSALSTGENPVKIIAPTQAADAGMESRQAFKQKVDQNA